MTFRPMASVDASETFYTFLVEWYDAQAAIVRSFHLRYFPQDSQLDMFDLKQRRTFLKKCAYPSIKLIDLYPGAQINVFARTLKVVDYADNFTRNALSNFKETIMLAVKSTQLADIAAILTDTARASFTLAQIRRCVDPAKGDVTYVQLIGPNASSAVEGFVRKAHEDEAKYGSVWTKVELYTGDNAKTVASKIFRPSAGTITPPPVMTRTTSAAKAQPEARPSTTAKLENCSVAVVRPHAVQTGLVGPILDILASAGFVATAIESFTLDKVGAQEFLEVYKGVVPEYHSMVEQLTSGLCVAIEVQYPADPASVVPKLREICGPSDPAVAQRIRPNTIRAKFGTTKVMNAIHCTDLPEDGVLESQYFFGILQK